MKDRLTKTAYLNYLKCPQEFWLDVNELPLFRLEPITLEHEHLRQQGYEVERYVKCLARFQPDEAHHIDFQRVLQTSELYARADLIVTDRATDIVDIYEIKSSSSVKPEHLDDVAFQKTAAERSGLTVGRCHVITLNNEYVRRGDIDAEELFTINDITESIDELMSVSDRQIADAIAYADGIPIPSLIEYCDANKLDCRFIKLKFPDLPDYTVFDIAFLKNDKRRELLSQGIVDITHVPDDFKLSAKQRAQVDAAKIGGPVIEFGKIAERLASWQYPLHFLDYETFSYAIPQFDGVRPFQHMCFQYSLHTISEAGADARHSSFLSHGDGDPPRAMAEHLKESMSDGIGTVLVWYEAFEKTRNSEMAGMFPDFADFFTEVNERTVDLMKIFSDNFYIHPAFKGRSSIKKVLPVMVPELSYKELGIGDGLTATISWFRAVRWDTMDDADREQIFNDLERYCELDTWAMVKIFEKLNQETGMAASPISLP